MAIKGQGSVLSVGSALSGGALALSAATIANPVVLTSAANTFATGDIVVVAGLVGPVNLNNRAFIAAAPTSTTVPLKGEDGTVLPNAAYVSGGTVQKWTMQAVGAVTDIQGFDGQSAEIDTTNVGSGAKEFLLGLQDFGQVTLTLLQISDAGQARLRAVRKGQLIVPFSIVLSDGTVATFMAGVKQYSFNGAKPDGVIGNSVTLRVTNEPAFFA